MDRNALTMNKNNNPKPRRRVAQATQVANLLRAMTLEPAGRVPARRRRRRNRRNRRARNPQSNSSGIPAAITRQPTASPNNMGVVVASRCELFTPLKTMANATETTGATPLYPTAECMPWLHKLAAAFERIEWLSATLCWKPFVGTSASGSVAFGVDWNSNAEDPVKREKVLATTPVYESPVWQSGQLQLPLSMLMSRRQYMIAAKDLVDRQPGTLIWSLAGLDSAAAKSVGELWVIYRVRLSGTTA